MFTITMKDGSQLTGLTINGSMFVSQKEVKKDFFTPARLKKVTITGADTEGNEKADVILNAVCDDVQLWPEGYMFNIRQMTAEEATNAGLLELAEVVYGGLV